MAESSLAGQVLLAHPSLTEANFCQTVVLMHSHAVDDGAIGVILNRPLNRVLGEVEKRFRDGPLAAVPLHIGGPVNVNQMAFGGWRFASRGPARIRYGLDESEAIELSNDPEFHLRAYVGYAGWTAGQLENEIRLNAWVTHPFDRLADGLEGVELWKAWMTRVRPDLRLLADSPGDLGLN
jgi:putative transcriptional regulator